MRLELREEVWAAVKQIRVWCTGRITKAAGTLSYLLPWELCSRAKVFHAVLRKKVRGEGSGTPFQ